MDGISLSDNPDAIRSAVGTPGVVGKVLQIHFPDHLLTQWCHELPPWFGLNKRCKVAYTIRSWKKKTQRLRWDNYRKKSGWLAAAKRFRTSIPTAKISPNAGMFWLTHDFRNVESCRYLAIHAMNYTWVMPNTDNSTFIFLKYVDFKR